VLNLIITVCIAALIVFFAVQNSGAVTLSFLFWKVDTSLAVVVFLSVLAGMLLAALIALSGLVKRRKKSKSKNDDIKEGGDR